MVVMKISFSTLIHRLRHFHLIASVSQMLLNRQAVKTVWPERTNPVRTIPFLSVKQTSITFTLDFTWCVLCEWRGTHRLLSLIWLLLRSRLIVVESFVTKNNLRKKARIDFQLSFQSTTWLILIFSKQARHKFCRNTFHPHFLVHVSLAGVPWYTRRIKFVNCSTTILQDYSMNFPVFTLSGVWRFFLNKLGFQATSGHSWSVVSTRVNLRFTNSSALVNSLKHDNFFGRWFPQWFHVNSSPMISTQKLPHNISPYELSTQSNKFWIKLTK